MSFSADPHLGMVADRFSGSAVVFLATTTFRAADDGVAALGTLVNSGAIGPGPRKRARTIEPYCNIPSACM